MPESPTLTSATGGIAPTSPEYKARQEEAERKEREAKVAREAALVGAPEKMTLRDAEGWKKACDANKDGYGGAVMTYAERWARMMEARMAKGERLADIADECSHLADEEGITGFMYGAAVSTLAAVWIHGEALRLWHNLKYQLRDEGKRANDNGGVLNPACLMETAGAQCGVEAACENCGGVATRITEDGIKLCQACYALCPEDDSAQNK